MHVYNTTCIVDVKPSIHYCADIININSQRTPPPWAVPSDRDIQPSLEPTGIPSTSPTHHLQLNRRETVAQWELRADSHTMKLLYYRNGNMKGVVNDGFRHCCVCILMRQIVAGGYVST